MTEVRYMTEVRCGLTECENNLDGECIASEIYLSFNHEQLVGCDEGYVIREEIEDARADYV